MSAIDIKGLARELVAAWAEAGPQWGRDWTAFIEAEKPRLMAEWELREKSDPRIARTSDDVHNAFTRARRDMTSGPELGARMLELREAFPMLDAMQLRIDDNVLADLFALRQRLHLPELVAEDAG